MINQCENPKCRSFKNYGGRGIKVCDRWRCGENGLLSGYQSFIADMGERPPGMTLDRINNDLGYFKVNCRWATRKEQLTKKEGWGSEMRCHVS
jgi:hypothetical protein